MKVRQDNLCCLGKITTYNKAIYGSQFIAEASASAGGFG